MLGQNDAKLSWISRTDAVRLMAFTLESAELEGAVNVVAPSAITQRTLTSTLSHRLGRKVRGRLPATLLRFAVGEFSRAILDDQNVVPTRAISAGFHFFHPTRRSCLDPMCEAPGLLPAPP